MADQDSVLTGFQLHGWHPDPQLSEDENYMDLVMLLTRNSKCRQGHMACVIVRPKAADDSSLSLLLDRIVTVANNTSVYKDRDSDNHAEINAISLAAKFGTATNGCTSFITMPPCKRCFGALVAAGISRIVSTRPILEPILSIAKDQKIDVVVMDPAASTNRIARYLPQPNRDEVVAARAQRDQEKRDRQLAGKERKRKAIELDADV